MIILSWAVDYSGTKFNVIFHNVMASEGKDSKGALKLQVGHG